MYFSFANKSVVISGGSSGIGFATAKSFLQCGANVFICSRSVDNLQIAAAELKSVAMASHSTLHWMSCNMSSEKDVVALVDKVREVHGRIDIFVNNSGSFLLKTIKQTEEHDIDFMVAANLKSTFWGCKLAGESIEQGGSIINVSSFAGILPIQGASLYSALKAAIINLTKTAAAELAPSNIRVNSVIPGLIRTPMTSERIDRLYTGLMKPLLIKNEGSPQDVAYGIIFLASEFAKYITGTSLEISGGKYATQLKDES